VSLIKGIMQSQPAAFHLDRTSLPPYLTWRVLHCNLGTVAGGGVGAAPAALQVFRLDTEVGQQVTRSIGYKVTR
jgi:hypothetical protein